MFARQILRCGRKTPKWILQRALCSEQKHSQNADKYVIKSSEPDLEIPNITIQEAVFENLERWAEKTAVICCETGRNYTYSEVVKKSGQLARSLRGALKLPKNSCIAIILPNVPEYSIALLGAMQAGIIATTVNPIYTAEEISRQLLDSKARAIITLVDSYRTVSLSCQNRLPIITIKTKMGQSTPDGAIDFTELCEKNIDYTDMKSPTSEDVAVLPYSSGTTGLPKGVCLTHKNIVSNFYQAELANDLLAETTKDNQDIVSCVLPMFHIYGMTMNTLKMMERGAKLVTMPKFTPDGYINMLKDYKPQHLFMVPPIIIFLGNHPSVTLDHLNHVKSMTNGAAPLGSTDLERLFKKVNKEIITMTGYGLTETSPGVCSSSVDRWKECLGSIGFCFRNTQLKIVSVEDGKTIMGPNEKGEIFIKGPQVMMGYHNNPKATEEVFEDGWFKTGDMAYYDDKQIFWIADRLKELIKVKGFQVAPAELEALIRDHPSVGDAAVIGIPHPMHGEVPKAFVVPKSGQTINVDVIKEYVAKNVASYKKLEGGVKVLDSIPKTVSGKILRKTLKEMEN